MHSFMQLPCSRLANAAATTPFVQRTLLQHVIHARWFCGHMAGASRQTWQQPLISTIAAQIAVIMVLLARLVHWQPALAGVLTTIVLVPITASITRKAAGVRKRLIGLTDARVKVCTEVVSGRRLMPDTSSTL